MESPPDKGDLGGWVFRQRDLARVSCTVSEAVLPTLNAKVSMSISSIIPCVFSDITNKNPARAKLSMSKYLNSVTAVRLLAALMIALIGLFLFNNYLVYWRDWSEFSALLDNPGLLASPATVSWQNWTQLFGYAAILVAVVSLVQISSDRSLRDDADMYARLAAYIVRAAYWAVLLIGLCDMLISFLRVEGLLEAVVGKQLTKQLGIPTFRGVYVHYPLLLVSLVIAWFARSLGFIWLTIAVVMAEFQVVVSRFVFSYEQVFMGDLIRFWYAALFLFASAYTLSQEGHVRVDVLYASFSKRGKALSNILGSLLLGLPLCWTIMLMGMSNKAASINSPLLGFEISQSGYGMYVKYLMAGFLLIFAVSMAIQFVSLVLENTANLRADSARPARANATINAPNQTA